MKGACFLNRIAFSTSITVVITCGCGGGNGGPTNAAPAVSSITPSTLTASPLPLTITVFGNNFQSGLAVTLTSGTVSTNPSPSQLTASSFQITAVFNAGAYTITVTNPDGHASSPFNFTVKTAAGIIFAPRVDYATGAMSSGPGSGSGSIAIADFDNDGKLDIVVSNYASNTISVFLNKGNGTFGSPVITKIDPLGAAGLGPLAAGDFNEDGKVDVIVSTIAGAESAIVLLGNGNGTFTEEQAIPNSFGVLQARAVDLNGDRHLDFLAGGNGNMQLALGKGDGTFNPAVFNSSGPFPNQYFGIDAGNVTGHGKLDIVGVDYCNNCAGDIVVFPGNDTGTFGTPSVQSTKLAGPDSVALADFNGDGKLDALIGYAPGMAAVALGNGDGTFNFDTESAVYSSSGGNGVTVQVADLDQDGKPDALTLDYARGLFTVILNDANIISSGSKYTFTIAPGVDNIAVGDLNGDGKPDVVIVNNLTNLISVFLSQ
jgi:hypothetical protein